MTEIESRIEAARQNAQAAQAKVNLISGKLFAELLKGSYRQAANHFNDPRLTMADIAKLKAHLQKQLSARPRRDPSLADIFSSMLMPMLQWPLRHPVLLSGSFALLIVGGIAWSSTPTVMGLGRLPSVPEMRWSDGSVQKLDDTYAVIGHRPGEWLIRVWRPFTGYETLAVSQTALVSAQ